ncbi:helix-turn-helix transcriptional regulator [Aeromonas dhakensis]|nr:helix-turn-helix transcriptional regulator [Aeromonas dhakensis]
MKTHTDVQIIKQAGKPAFAVIPYDRYLELTNSGEQVYVPNEVVGLQIEQGLSPIAAWRTYKGLSQQELADRIGVKQPTMANMEKPGTKPQLKTLKKVAAALGITVEHLTD